MTARRPQPLFPYSVKIKPATGTDAALPITLLTPKQAEELQVEFKKIARDAGVRGARISVQRLRRRLRHGAARSQGLLAESNAQSCLTQYWGYDLRELGERAPALLCKDQVPRSLKWSSRASMV